MRTKSVILIMVLFVLLTQTGCWNAREINELAFVLSIALDKADNGFKVTVQMAKPETYSKSTTGGMKNVENEKPFWVVTSTGKTIFEAIRNMASVSSRRIFWPHIRIIIISEELARSNLLEIFDFFTRNPELRMRTWVAVTQGEAGKILEIVPMMEKDTSQNIEKIIDKATLTGKAYGIMIKDFLEDYLDPFSDPVASRIITTEIESKQTIKLEGACVFGSNNMLGWLNDSETRGLLWVKNKISGSIKVVNCPHDNLPVTVEIKKGKTNIKSYFSNGIPHFTIIVSAEGKVTEKGCSDDFRSPQSKHDLENVLASAISNDIQQTVNASRKFGSDFISLSRVLQRQHRNEWHKISSNWSEVLKNIQVTIEVKTKIPELSLLVKSLYPQKNSENSFP